ncbi:MAG: hypothetical protein ABI683_15180, partial [Ginsengibacter sp.]
MRFAVVFSMIILMVKSSVAQVNTASLTFQAVFPAGDYKKNYDIVPMGLLFNILHELPDQPAFSYGGEVGILQVSGSDKYYTGVYDNEYNTYVVASWNHIVTIGAIFKVNLLPENKFFDIEIDVRAGTNIFITTSSISRDVGINPITNTEITKYYYSDNRVSMTLRMGGGVGFAFPFGRQKKISAILKASYFYGTHAKYYARPSIVNTQIILSPKNSGTS